MGKSGRHSQEKDSSYPAGIYLLKVNKRNTKTRCEISLNLTIKTFWEKSRSYSEKVRAKWFWCAFNLGFLQLICKDSLSFSVSFTNFFEAKRIIWAKACCCGLQLLQNMRLVILFDMFLNPSFKMATSFGNIARTPGSTSKFIC